MHLRRASLRPPLGLRRGFYPDTIGRAQSPSRSCTNGSLLDSCDPILIQRNFRIEDLIHLLFVGPSCPSCGVRDLLSRQPGIEVVDLSDYRSLWDRALWTAVDLAVLCETLSCPELEQSCRFIRRQWPLGRILVIRESAGFLDDSLYDERVHPAATREILVGKIARMLDRRHV
jgi:hypothetical protein